MLTPYSPANVIGYVGNVSSIYFFSGSLYVLKGSSLYLFKNHSLHFLTKVTSFHPPFYVLNGSLYLINGTFLTRGENFLFHGCFALVISNGTFQLFKLERLVLEGPSLKIPRDFYYYEGSLYLLVPPFLYVFSEGREKEVAKVPNSIAIYCVNGSEAFLQGYEYNGMWNVSVLEIVSLKNGKLLEVMPCSWFSYPYAVSQKTLIDLRNGKEIAKGVIKADYNGKVLVCLHDNSSLEIIKGNEIGWIPLQEMPAIVKAVGEYAFAYFLLVAHKRSYIAIYTIPQGNFSKEKKEEVSSAPVSLISGLIFLAVLIALGVFAYYIFRRRRLFFFFLALSDANRAIKPMAATAPTKIAMSL